MLASLIYMCYLIPNQFRSILQNLSEMSVRIYIWGIIRYTPTMDIPDTWLKLIVLKLLNFKFTHFWSLKKKKLGKKAKKRGKKKKWHLRRAFLKKDKNIHTQKKNYFIY